MQLTTFTDYSLRAMMFMAQHNDRLCNVKEIAEFYDISRNHLVKVVHRLSQLGYVVTQKGKGGGIRLAAHAQGLKLGDLVTQLEPHMHLVECFGASNKCRITASCKLRHVLYDSQKAFLGSLNAYTLADIL